MMMIHLLQLDRLVQEWVITHRAAGLDLVMWLLSAVGRGGLLFVVLGALAALKQRRARALVDVVAAIIIASTIADRVLKPMIHRPRPFESSPTIMVIGGKPEDASMPSGHAANAVAGALTLSRIAPSAAWLWWSVAAAIMYSRVYLGVHYP